MLDRGIYHGENPAINMKINSIHALNRMVVLGTAILFFGCVNDLEKVMDLTSDREQPILVTHKVRLTYADSTGPLFRLEAPLREIYLGEQPRSVMAQGMKLEMGGPKNRNYLVADTGIFYDKSGLMEAIGNVKMVRHTGDTLKTSRLFWNERSKMIFTRELVWIVSPNGRVTELLGMIAYPDSTTFLHGNQARMTLPVSDF